MAEDDGKPVRALGTRDIEHGPVAAERMFIEEPDPTERLGKAARRDLANGGEVEHPALL